MKKFAVNLWEITYPMLIYFLVMVMVSLAGGIVLGVYAGITDPDMSDAMFEELILKYSLHMTFVAAAITMPFLYLFKRRDDMKQKMAGIFKQFEKVDWYKYLLIIPFALFTMYSANVFVSVLMLFMPDFMLKSYDGTEAAIYGGSFLIQVLAAGILGPIVEEYVFRGLIYKRCLRFSSPIVAGLISSLSFGIFHWNWVQLPYAFLLGLALAFVYEKYKNIFAPILLHMTANLIAVFITELTKDMPVEDTQLPVVQQLITYVPMVVVTGAIAIVFAVLINKSVDAKEIKNEVIDSSDSML